MWFAADACSYIELTVWGQHAKIFGVQQGPIGIRNFYSNASHSSNGLNAKPGWSISCLCFPTGALLVSSRGTGWRVQRYWHQNFSGNQRQTGHPAMFGFVVFELWLGQRIEGCVFPLCPSAPGCDLESWKDSVQLLFPVLVLHTTRQAYVLHHRQTVPQWNDRSTLTQNQKQLLTTTVTVHTGTSTHMCTYAQDMRQCVTERQPSKWRVRTKYRSKSVSKYDLRSAVMPLCGPQRLCGFRKQIEQNNKVRGTVQGGAAVVY